ncbi:hypothetical protein FOZ63_002470, partial [Perkinsus olseni]
FEAFFLDYPTQESVDPDVFTAVWPAVMDDIEDLWEEYAGKGHGAPRQSPPRKAGSTAEVLKSSCAGLSVEKRGTDRRRMLSAARETKRRLQGFERVSKKKDESPTGIVAPSKDSSAVISSLRSQLARTKARLFRKEKEKAVIMQRSWYPEVPGSNPARNVTSLAITAPRPFKILPAFGFAEQGARCIAFSSTREDAEHWRR